MATTQGGIAEDERWVWSVQLRNGQTFYTYDRHWYGARERARLVFGYRRVVDVRAVGPLAGAAS